MRRLPVLWFVFCAVAVGASAIGSEAEPAEPWRNSAFSPDRARRFDFWIGDWTVNLRTLQEDLTWQDSVAARAKVYSILGGKAILELWDSDSIKGFSLRTFDPAKEKWVLWLNWPGKNRSGSSSLEGSFRHGRGDFFSRRTDADGIQRISRYSFNDIGPDTLRWDDAYSQDGGRTWSHQWVMEFRRLAAEPSWPEADAGHTYRGGALCDREEFRRYEFLAGRWTGEARSLADETEKPTAARWRGLKVLDGCALLLFQEYPSEAGTLEAFAQLTYNTYASRYELMLLDSVAGSPVQMLYGTADGGTLELLHRSSPQEAADYKLRYRQGEDGSAIQDFYRPGAEPDSWHRLATLVLRRE